MKKYFISLVAALMCATATFAQSKLVAVLSHGDEFKMFYGTSALVDAVGVAESGDAITLSGGTFTCARFTKGITIRGAGINAKEPTIIGYTDYNNHNNTIDISQSESSPFVMEGVVVKLGDNLEISGEASNFYFIKCKFESKISFSSSSSARATFVDCEISNFSLDGANGVKFSNCLISGFSNSKDASSKAEFFNCLVTGNQYGIKLYNSSFVNCILATGTNYDGYSLPSETTAMNCLTIGINFPFNNINSAIDCLSIENSDIPNTFKTFSSWKDRWGTEWYTPTEPYELTDEAKTKYLGTDGKEMGLYGGQYPYDFTPMYPHFTKLNVAKQTTADNKLSVDIEVTAAE